MSAETLRKAAALIRERATAATPGPWGFSRVALRGGRGVGTVVHQRGEPAGFVLCDPDPCARLADAEHVASWHPDVTLFVAEWLDQAADWREDNPDDVDDDPDLAEVNDPALVFARAYLGEQP